MLEKITKEQKYDITLNDVWETFRNRIYTKVGLSDLDDIVRQEIINFIYSLYEQNIFIMQKGELEDYYKKENFGEEFTNISGKGITAYKISELSTINGIETYIEIDEYKNILSHIF